MFNEVGVTNMFDEVGVTNGFDEDVEYNGVNKDGDAFVDVLPEGTCGLAVAGLLLM